MFDVLECQGPPLQVGECFNVGQLKMFEDQSYSSTQSLECFETFGGSQTQSNEQPSCLFRHKSQLVMGGNLIDLSSSCVCHDFLLVHCTKMFDVLKHWMFTMYGWVISGYLVATVSRKT